MRETGAIISISGKIATIQLSRGSQCEGCNLCSAFGENNMKLEAVNKIGAQVGDLVEVDVEPQQVVKSSMIMFIFPLIMMIGGYFFGVTFIPPHSEGAGIIGSLAALVLAFLLIRLTEGRRNADNLTPAVIVDIAQKKFC